MVHSRVLLNDGTSLVLLNETGTARFTPNPLVELIENYL